MLTGKDVSLDNSMLNYPGHVTLTSCVFKKFLPVVGIIKILKSLKYKPLTPSGSEVMVFLNNDKLMMMIGGGAAKYINFLDKFLK